MTPRVPVQQERLGPTTNLSLWLDRYLSMHEQAHSALIQALGGVHVPSGYAAHVEHWTRCLQTMGTRLTLLRCTTEPRVVVGLGAVGVAEAGLALHHTYGVPVLPASALRGLASGYAARMYEGWEVGGERHTALFGTPEGRGWVQFMDALPQPRTWALHPEVMTVHHQQYYMNRKTLEHGLPPPADWDEPVPNPFLSVSGTFLVPLLVNQDGEEGRQALAAARTILSAALADEGLGAKTGSGYGRLRVIEDQAAGA